MSNVGVPNPELIADLEEVRDTLNKIIERAQAGEQDLIDDINKVSDELDQICDNFGDSEKNEDADDIEDDG